MGQWAIFNAQLQATSDERKLLRMLRKELVGLARPPYIDRIYGRFSRCRSMRERSDLREFQEVPRV